MSCFRLLDLPEPRFFLADVIPRPRNNVKLPCKLNLKHHESAIAEPGFSRCKIELPHTAEPVAENGFRLSAMTEKTTPPRGKSIGIVKPEDLDVRNDESRLLNRRQDLGQ